MEIKVTRKTIREFVKNGEAVDITNISLDDSIILLIDKKSIVICVFIWIQFYSLKSNLNLKIQIL